MQLHHFYNGLTRTTRTLLGASVGGALMSKSANESYQLLELSKSQAQFVNGTRTSLTNQVAQLRNLELQMG